MGALQMFASAFPCMRLYACGGQFSISGCGRPVLGVCESVHGGTLLLCVHMQTASVIHTKPSDGKEPLRQPESPVVSMYRLALKPESLYPTRQHCEIGELMHNL